ncbi:MAG TPA: hotdog fold thioesterase [Rubrivivax sp.]|nr:hotdog fold thioesterase [Burkholderiales bacterium]HNT39129.1 hotdog fold thioesterase [Rubrivivax sp.]
MPAIWTRPLSIEILHAVHVGTAPEHLGMEFLEVGDDFIRARAPVDTRTRQPLGILHGGVSVLLAETLGSCGAAFSVPEGRIVVGLDINANHLRAVKSGWISGVTRPVHRGRSTHVWQIDIVDGQERPVCVSRLTLAVLEGAP